MKEEDVPGFHLDVPQLEHALGLLHSLRVGPGLLSGGHVIDPAQGVAGFQDLETTVGLDATAGKTKIYTI